MLGREPLEEEEQTELDKALGRKRIKRKIDHRALHEARKNRKRRMSTEKVAPKTQQSSEE